MIEFIILGIITLLLFGFAMFIFNNMMRVYGEAQKQNKLLQEQVKSFGEMLMAGSLQEYARIKKGRKPIPNNIKEEPNMLDITENNRIPWDEITGVQVDNGPKRDIRIYET